MRRLDKAQNKLLADFCEKFALALFTAVAAKVFFAEEGMTVMTYCAITVAVTLLLVSLTLAQGTDEKARGETLRYERRKRKRKNGNTERR